MPQALNSIHGLGEKILEKVSRTVLEYAGDRTTVPQNRVVQEKSLLFIIRERVFGK